MSAREWLRRRIAAWAYPEIGRLDQAVATAQQDRAAAEARNVDYARQLAHLGFEREALLVELDGARSDIDQLARERDTWRWRARSAPLTPVDEAAERARHARVEQTGGR